MKKALLAVCLCGALGACETVYPPAPPPPPAETRPVGPGPAFRAHDFSWSAEHGNAAIHGDVTFQRGGRPYGCAGQSVILTADAPYSHWRMAQLYGSPERAAVPVSEVRSRQESPPPDEYSSFVRRTTCDAQGHFSFQGLPVGGWFVVVVAQPRGGGEPIALMRRVETRAGLIRNLILD